MANLAVPWPASSSLQLFVSGAGISVAFQKVWCLFSHNGQASWPNCEELGLKLKLRFLHKDRVPNKINAGGIAGPGPN